MSFTMIGWAILCLVIVAGVAYKVKSPIGVAVEVLCGLLAAWLFFLVLTSGGR
jgi:hypothetical protein